MVESSLKLSEHERTKRSLGAVVAGHFGLFEDATATILTWTGVAGDGRGRGVEDSRGVFTRGDDRQVGGQIPSFEL